MMAIGCDGLAGADGITDGGVIGDGAGVDGAAVAGFGAGAPGAACQAARK